jgi:molybdenum cofactor biosynthesis enzyme MoaA
MRLPMSDGAMDPSSAGSWRHRSFATKCNLGCEFCQKQSASEAWDAGGSHERIVVTGGDPLLQGGLLAELRRHPGAIAVETNGALLHRAANVRRLADAGVGEVRLFLPGWDREATDCIARVPGVAALQEQAARNVTRAELELSFVVPVTEQHAAQLVDYLGRVERLAESRSPSAGPVRVYLSWALPRQVTPSAKLEVALARLALTAVRRGIVVTFDGPLAPAACAFRRPEAFASLFAGSMEPRHKPEACARCPATTHCHGPANGQEPAPLSADGRDDVAYRSAVTTLQAAADVQDWIFAGDAQRWGRQNFVSIGSEPDLMTGGVVHSALIRPFFHCNQDCTFCWVDLEQPRAPDAAIRQALAAMALEGMAALSITGGEPTLDKRLPDQIRLARALGVTQVTLQTNAVRLDRPELAQALAEAGLTRAFVSLHGAEAAVSDSITRTPDTFVRTVQGIRNLLDAGVSVGVGIVFTNENRHQARAIVSLLGGPLEGADLTLSVAAPVNDRVDASRVTPRYSSLVPTLREAAYTARELGIRFAGLFGQCGVPPCILEGDPVCFPELEREHPEWSAPQDFVYAPACEACSLYRKCPGVRANYAAVHGTDELHPI